MTIEKALILGIRELNKRQIEESSLKVRMLLAHILNQKKEYLISHSADELSIKDENEFIKGIQKLKKNIPIQYITNSQEFMGFEFYVDENVLIPQPDTETLVIEVLEIAKKLKEEKKDCIRILDLCTGSGAIGISISKILGDGVLVTCSDISKEALKIVEINSQKNHANIGIIESDMFENINRKFDIIVSNPPYIETSIIKTLDREVKYEPKLALDGGKDGLKFYRKITDKSKEYLNNGGFIAVEIGYNQKEKVTNLFECYNYRNIYSKKDLAGNDRVVVANIDK